MKTEIDQRLVDRIIAHAQNSAIGLSHNGSKCDLGQHANPTLESVAHVLVSSHESKYDLISLMAAAMEVIQSDAIESTVRKCAEMIKHKCDQWPCFDSEYCRSRTDAVNEILSLIPQKEKKL